MPDEPLSPDLVDLLHRVAATRTSGAVWSYAGADLNANLLYFDAGEGVAPHVNDEVEVLVVAIAGEGEIAIAGTVRPIRAGQACVIPKGTRRAIRSAGGPFAYLTCHRRRGGLWPA